MRAPDQKAPALEWALFYASLGWEVFPIRPQTKNGFYRYPEYANPEGGSVYSWKAQASKDPERIRRYWSEHPEAGIGMATGQRSGGVYVLDLDKPKEGRTQGGVHHLHEWEKEHGQTLNVNTAVSRTGSGGTQVFYHCTERPRISGTASGAGAAAIYPGYGVDTRGDGNFVVLPPSIHPNGTAYAWRRSPADFPVKAPNAAVLEYWTGDRSSPTGSEHGEHFDLPELIGEGSRTQTLVRYAGSVVSRAPGLSEEELRALVRLVNETHCRPPLSDRELEREVLGSVAKFKAREAAKDFGGGAPDPEPEPVPDTDDYAGRTAAAALESFWRDTGNLAEPIPTGFPLLDEFFDGGLYPGLYILGAVSSLGKTTFVLQIADQIAKAGTDVLIFSLEMSRAELMSKSLSRLTAQISAKLEGESVASLVNLDRIPNAKTARALTDPRRIMNYRPEERDLVEAASVAYREMGIRIWIDEGPKGGDVDSAYIRKRVEEHISITGRRPVVFVDYLQIMGGDPHLTDKQKTDRDVKALRTIGRDNRLPVFAISSFNRENYSQEVSMTAFKESGAIEYSSDVLLGLQPQGMEEGKDKAKDNQQRVEKTKRLQVRPLELKVLKQRSAATGRRISYNYTPAFNVFEEGDESFAPERPKRTRQKAAPAAPLLERIAEALGLLVRDRLLDQENPFTKAEEDLDDF